MKIIALEEHFWTPAIRAAFQRIEPSQRDERLDRFNREPMASKLENLGTSRLQEMDAVGIDVAVLSLTTPATQIFPPSEAVPLARDANDSLAAVIKAHPDRFAGFATLPTPNPEAAAQELERAIHTLGFKGAMIHGRTGERLLDHPTFRPLLETAAALDVPLYIHPQMPSGVVQSAYYTGFESAVNTALASGGWGWHMETAINVLRLILAGVFDRSPTLQVILGHWGEMLPFYLERVDTLSSVATHLHRRVADYIQQNTYLTPSGIWSVPSLLHALEMMGADRIMFSTDYPFQYAPNGRGRAFLEEAPLSRADKEKIGHLNAEKVLKLSL